jgi:hypothetical protein
VWTLVFSILGLGGLEVIARQGGVEPAYEPSPRLWSYWAKRVDQADVVLLGTSKSQLALDPAAVADDYDASVVNLAVNGADPAPMLKFVADSTSFDGLAIVGFSHVAYFVGKTSWDERASRYLAYHQGQAWSEGLENAVRFWVQGHLSLVQPQVEPFNLVKRLLQGGLPHPFYVTTEFDRWQRADYRDGYDVPAEKDPKAAPVLRDPEELDATLRGLAKSVRKIRERGGEVVFVRHPSSGAQLAYEDQHFAGLEQRFASATKAQVIDFRQVPGATFECGDGIHLDFRDSGPYTRALFAELARRFPARIKAR